MRECVYSSVWDVCDTQTNDVSLIQSDKLTDKDICVQFIVILCVNIVRILRNKLIELVYE